MKNFKQQLLELCPDLPEEHIISAWPCGSYYTVSPPVTTTDKDWSVLTGDIATFNCLEGWSTADASQFGPWTEL